MRPIDRRDLLKAASTAIGIAAAGLRLNGVAEASTESITSGPVDGQLIGDTGWTLWLDKQAPWKDDEIFLPEDVRLEDVHPAPPTGGWHELYTRREGNDCRVVTLPTTAEEHFWGTSGARPYTPEEYRYAASDPEPKNGAYYGVSWFYKMVDIPASMAGKRILLVIRGARQRAEVFLNETLVGYSIIEELPFTCDLTATAKPGRPNHLAIRITNPGGRFDWMDYTTSRWGQVEFQRSHGFGGLDRELLLRAVPMESHIDDAWVLNTPDLHTVTARVKLSTPPKGEVMCEVLDANGEVVLNRRTAEPLAPSPGDAASVSASLSVPSAKIWTLDSPALYSLRVTYALPDGQKDLRHVRFGFRWFSPDGIGSDAVLRLNGRRVKLYSAISWGYWGFNGLFPTPQLARREVTQAKRLNLNCLSFHRNVGKVDVLRAQDELGLLRSMEPGGGTLSMRSTPKSSSESANTFSRRYMIEKCRRMVRTFRSHPSLIQFTLQNELGGTIDSPGIFDAIRIMHEEDPSRCVVLNDGFTATTAPQAWFAPYSDKLYRSDEEPFGRWWDMHQGAADQWYDRLYKDPAHFTYNQPLKESLVEFGEMMACAVADNHPLMVHQIDTREFGGQGRSYDLADHTELADAYERFFDRWGFRKAFPSSNTFFRSLGAKCYQSWEQYMENVRLRDELDIAAISGWESTAIDNHAGIVDNLRNLNGDPDCIAKSLLPLRPVAKQHALCVRSGEPVILDLFLLNETGATPSGKLRLEMVTPSRRRLRLGEWDTPNAIPDRFTYPVQAGFTSPALTEAGVYRVHFNCDAAPAASFTREIWAIGKAQPASRRLRIAYSGITDSMKKLLDSYASSGAEVEAFTAGRSYGLIVASGVIPGLKLGKLAGEKTGMENPANRAAAPPQAFGQLTSEVLAAVQAGTPLLASVPDDVLAEGVARQLADLAAFPYKGQVGTTRAAWMGSWNFVREHPTFDGIPSNCVLGVYHQASGQPCNGLLFASDMPRGQIEIIVGYSRDHDRNIGASSFVCRVGQTPVLVHRLADMTPPIQERWLANSINFLARQTR